MSWGSFHCEITWNIKWSSKINLSYFMLTHNGNHLLMVHLLMNESDIINHF